jgi:hypothetical protein
MKERFRFRGRVHTRALLEAIERVPGMWSWITERQDYDGSAHAETQCIVLRGPAGPDMDRPFDCLEAGDWWASDVVRAALDDVLGQIFEFAPWKELGRVMVVRLPPDASVLEHIDEGAYAEHYTTRLHVAMTNTPRAYLEVDGERLHMAQHDCWQFDHRRKHSARNLYYGRPRIHLIADMVEE